jgi:hypothetical protein
MMRIYPALRRKPRRRAESRDRHPDSPPSIRCRAWPVTEAGTTTERPRHDSSGSMSRRRPIAREEDDVVGVARVTITVQRPDGTHTTTKSTTPSRPPKSPRLRVKSGNPCAAAVAAIIRSIRLGRTTRPEPEHEGDQGPEAPFRSDIEREGYTEDGLHPPAISRAVRPAPRARRRGADPGTARRGSRPRWSIAGQCRFADDRQVDDHGCV